jgi:hypothetical protein
LWRGRSQTSTSALSPIAAAQRNINGGAAQLFSHRLISTIRPLILASTEFIIIQGTSSLGLGDLLLLDAAGGAGGGAGAHLLELVLLVFGGEDGSAVELFVELDDFRVDGFELGFVEVVAGGGAEAVGAAARVGGVVVVVFELGEADGTPKMGM